MNPQDNSAIVIEDEPLARAPAAAEPASIVIEEEPDGVAVVDEDDDGEFKLPKRAKRNDDGTITLTLYEPIPVIIKNSRTGNSSKTYDALTFGRLNGEAITAVSNASKESQPIVLLSKSTRISHALMDALWKKMDGSDIVAAQDIVASFFETGPKTRRRT